MLAVFLGCFSIFIVLLFLNYLSGGENLFRCSFASVGLGFGSFLAVNAAGVFTGVTLPCSLLSLGVSLAGGPAGVASLLVLQTWLV